MEDYRLEVEIREHHVYIRVPGHQYSVRLTVTPLLRISRMSKISSEFLDQKCDLYSGKDGIKTEIIIELIEKWS